MLLNILTAIVLPLFLLMAIGYIMDRQFKLDVQTISRINFYVFNPALVFNLIYRSTLSVSEITGIGVFYVVHSIVLFMLAFGVFTVRPFRDRRTELTLGSVVHNIGNYGIPFMLLAFGEEAVGVAGIILVVQATMFFSLGLMFLAGAHKRGIAQSVAQVLRYPVLYALVLGVVMRTFKLVLPEPIDITLEYLIGAYVALALINLGVQLSKCRFLGDLAPVSIIVLMRFVAAPLLAALLIPLFGFAPRLSAMLIVQAALPVAVNVYLAATELGRDGDLVSRMIFWTTVLSIIILPIILLIVP